MQPSAPTSTCARRARRGGRGPARGGAPRGPASAHAVLRSTNPAANTTVPTAPAEVVLTFSEAVSPVADRVRVLAPDGTRADSGAPVARDSELSIPMRTDVPRGTYLVSYRVISADGHPVGGSFTYSVGAPSATPIAEDGDSGTGGWAQTAMAWSSTSGTSASSSSRARRWCSPRCGRAGSPPRPDPARPAGARPGRPGHGRRPGAAGALHDGRRVDRDHRGTAGRGVGHDVRYGPPGAPRGARRGGGAAAARAGRPGRYGRPGAARGPRGRGPGDLAVRRARRRLAAAGRVRAGRRRPPRRLAVWLGGLLMLVGFLLPRAHADELDAILPVWSRWARLSVPSCCSPGPSRRD